MLTAVSLKLTRAIRIDNHVRGFEVQWIPRIQSSDKSPTARFFSGNCFIGLDNKLAGESRLQTLAIESSCDDTAVAVLSISRGPAFKRFKTEVLFHEKVTANSNQYGGIHPLVALDSHQKQMGILVQKAIQRLQSQSKKIHVDRCQERPDFVSVTRGPGMRSNLAVGLDTAKGLALAWNVPLVGVHHMQAHALTPRLCSTLDNDVKAASTLHHNLAGGHKTAITDSVSQYMNPEFPFLSLLVSGGHTMLIDSKALTDHRILAESQDIAIGDYLDKAARAILTPSELVAPYGKALEDFAFSLDESYAYRAPISRQSELESRITQSGWSVNPPLAESKGIEKSSRRMVYSFTGVLSSIQRFMQSRIASDAATADMPTSDRREMAMEVQRVAFEHLGSRILLYLESLQKRNTMDMNIKTIVVSGGVASNNFLRHVLRSMLDARGYKSIQLLFPPSALCTDNALMIAWAGMEMFDAGYESELSISPLRKWSMDPSAEDGGILGVGGWINRMRPDPYRPLVDKA